MKELKRNDIDARVVVKGSGTLKQCYHRPLGSSSCGCGICEQGTPCRTRHVVYDAECDYCTQNYEGVTTRPFYKRYNEHEASIRFGDEKSALSTHLLGTEDVPPCRNPERSIKGFTWKFIDRGRSYKDSFMREGVLIHTNQPKINRNVPGWVKYMKI